MTHDSPVSSKVPSKRTITSLVSLVERACYRVLCDLVTELGLYVTPRDDASGRVNDFVCTNEYFCAYS